MTSVATTASSSDSPSYQQLEKLINMGLQRSRNALDTQPLIDATYDNDIFGTNGGSGGDEDGDGTTGMMDNETNEMLTTVMNDMLNKINDSILEQPEEVGSNDTTDGQQQPQRQLKPVPVILKIKERLEWVDNTVNEIQKQEKQRNEEERNDQQSAQTALKTTLLPSGITMSDVLRYTEYQQQLKEKEELENAIAQLKTSIGQLEDEQSIVTKQVQDQLSEIQSVSKNLGQSADTCSSMLL